MSPPSNQPLFPAEAIVRVALPVPLDQTFDYALDAEQPRPEPGCRVLAPFGGRTLVGICTELDPPDPFEDPKPLLAVIDETPLLSAASLGAARWLSDYYHHPIGEVLETMLPAEARRGKEALIRRPTEWRAVAEEGPKRAPKQRALLEHLTRLGPQTASALREAGFERAVVQRAAAAGLVEAQTRRLAATAPPPSPAPYALTDEQAAAVAAVMAPEGDFNPVLLDGITGSGKTEVYIQALTQTLERGRQALMLVPEIGLTPQVVRNLSDRLGQVEVVHSGLRDPDRYQAWLKCRAGEVRVLIGTRSAVFTEFQDLGLIIVDEEHDGSFKQQDGLRYSARDYAAKRAHDLGIPLLLGSATPSLESLHNARTGRYRRVALTRRPGGASLPTFKLLDIRGHGLQDGLSPALVALIRQHLEAAGQVLVFLNRRGFAPSLLCAQCDWQAMCERCDIRLTLHRSPPHLRCHHCGLQQPVPSACPSCTSTSLLPIGVGTQRTEARLAELFGEWPVIRIDRDTARGVAEMDASLATVREGRPLVLIGTQMLAKGHHFPAVTLVAVVNADAGFFSPDFRAPERTAQTIMQVAGRAGRAERPGNVWIQTQQPEHPVLSLLLSDGYGAFADNELSDREAAGLPPFQPMALIRADAEEAAAGLAFLTSLKARLKDSAAEAEVSLNGPVPAPIQRIANRHRYQLMLLAASRRGLHRLLKRLRQLAGQRSVAGLRWSIDVDPLDLS